MLELHVVWFSVLYPARELQLFSSQLQAGFHRPRRLPDRASRVSLLPVEK